MIREEITQRTIEYLNDTDFKGEKPSLMIVDFVIQKFKEHRHYPSSFSEEKVEKDMEKYIPIMAMAVVDLMCKEGAEGEISHSETVLTENTRMLIFQNQFLAIYCHMLAFYKEDCA